MSVVVDTEEKRCFASGCLPASGFTCVSPRSHSPSLAAAASSGSGSGTLSASLRVSYASSAFDDGEANGVGSEPTASILPLAPPCGISDLSDALGPSLALIPA